MPADKTVRRIQVRLPLTNTAKSIALISGPDPDGNDLEFSFGQKVGLPAEA